MTWHLQCFSPEQKCLILMGFAVIMPMHQKYILCGFKMFQLSFSLFMWLPGCYTLYMWSTFFCVDSLRVLSKVIIFIWTTNPTAAGGESRIFASHMKEFWGQEELLSHLERVCEAYLCHMFFSYGYL